MPYYTIQYAPSIATVNLPTKIFLIYLYFGSKDADKRTCVHQNKIQEKTKFILISRSPIGTLY